MNNRQSERIEDEVTIVLRKIVELQRRSVREELGEKFCDHDFLGEEQCNDECNTRPIMLFTCQNISWDCPINRDVDECHEENHEKTCVFRVERVLNGTVTLRALKEVRFGEEIEQGGERRGFERKFKSTDSFITIKLECIGAIRCLRDTFVDLCIR